MEMPDAPTRPGIASDVEMSDAAEGFGGLLSAGDDTSASSDEVSAIGEGGGAPGGSGEAPASSGDDENNSGGDEEEDSDGDEEKGSGGDEEKDSGDKEENSSDEEEGSDGDEEENSADDVTVSNNADDSEVSGALSSQDGTGAPSNVNLPHSRYFHRRRLIFHGSPTPSDQSLPESESTRAARLQLARSLREQSLAQEEASIQLDIQRQMREVAAYREWNEEIVDTYATDTMQSLDYEAAVREFQEAANATAATVSTDVATITHPAPTLVPLAPAYDPRQYEVLDTPGNGVDCGAGALRLSGMHQGYPRLGRITTTEVSSEILSLSLYVAASRAEDLQQYADQIVESDWFSSDMLRLYALNAGFNLAVVMDGVAL